MCGGFALGGMRVQVVPGPCLPTPPLCRKHHLWDLVPDFLAFFEEGVANMYDKPFHIVGWSGLPKGHSISACILEV